MIDHIGISVRDFENDPQGHNIEAVCYAPG